MINKKMKQKTFLQKEKIIANKKVKIERNETVVKKKSKKKN